ncbi:unnamed protein product [Acidithrix sp. C25]|nr:unnamed protein product [Acidithrix sp. C25]
MISWNLPNQGLLANLSIPPASLTKDHLNQTSKSRFLASRLIAPTENKR